MKTYLRFFVGIIFLAGIAGIILRTSVVKNDIKVVVPTPIPTLTPTPSPRPTPKPTPRSTPTPSPIPQPQFTSEQINGFIEGFAGQYNVDPNVLRHIAICESGFRSNAANGLYIGLYQFGKVTWINNRKLMGEDINLNLRLNAEESVQTAAYVISIGRIGVWPNCHP